MGIVFRELKYLGAVNNPAGRVYVINKCPFLIYSILWTYVELLAR